MSEKIQRVNTYEDNRFDTEVLNQHGAFIVDDKYKCSFVIINKDSAIVKWDKEVEVNKAIDEFRFYSEHIVNFYNEDMELVRNFNEISIFDIEIKDIQPSQFFVDKDKIEAIKSFIRNEKDIIIPLVKINDSFVSLDGHTRLYYAVSKKYSKVKGYLTEAGDYINGFVEETRKRGVYSPYDLELISHKEYEIKWHKFCEDFFKLK